MLNLSFPSSEPDTALVTMTSSIEVFIIVQFKINLKVTGLTAADIFIFIQHAVVFRQRYDTILYIELN